MANIESIAPIFGAQQQSDGTYKYVPERFPNNWYRTGEPFTLVSGVTSLLDSITTRAIPFGANAGSTGDFIPFGTDVTKLDVNGLACLLRDAVQATVPSTLATGLVVTVTSLLGDLFSLFDQFGCPAYNATVAQQLATFSQYRR